MISNLPESPRSRITLLRVALVVCLLCLCAGTALQHVTLTNVQKQIDDTARTPQVAALENRVAELNAHVGELAQKPTLDPARHEADLKALEAQQHAMNQEISERLAKLELSLKEGPTLPELSALDNRIVAKAHNNHPQIFSSPAPTSLVLPSLLGKFQNRHFDAPCHRQLVAVGLESQQDIPVSFHGVSFALMV